jgi:hypothetical protein
VLSTRCLLLDIPCQLLAGLVVDGSTITQLPTI